MCEARDCRVATRRSSENNIMNKPMKLDMDESQDPKPRRRRIAPSPVEELSGPESYDTETPQAEEPDDKIKTNLYRESGAIADRYGAFIGRDAFYCAVNEFEPRREDFDELGTLTIEGAYKLTRLMGEAIAKYRDYSCRFWQGMTKAELNTMREVQGLPPV